MKQLFTKKLLWLGAVAIFWAVGASAASASTATRSFSSANPIVGSTLTVSVAVDVLPPDTFYLVDEVLPAGLVIADPGLGDITQPGHIKWLVLSGAASTVYNYTVNIPADATGSYTFSGEYAFDSDLVPVPTLGETVINVQTDVTAPVITLLGNGIMDVEYGSMFVDPGATSSDNIDGDISVNIVVTGSVNTAVLGQYLLTYNVSDAAGNAAISVVRTVNVIDTVSPVITLNGLSPMDVFLNGLFVDPGAAALDNADGDISGNIMITGTVDSTILGQYLLTYNVSDSSGNAAIAVTRTVNVVLDAIAPTIVLNGVSPMDVAFGSVYAEQGADWTDNIDGTGAAVVGGQVVDTNILGAYIVTYDYTDTSGNPAIQVSRTVNVIDNEAPVIALNGPATVNIPFGGIYAEQGATWTDNVDGTGAAVVGGQVVDVNMYGTYIVTYDYTDMAGNPAIQISRTVNIVDAVAPVITLNGSSTMDVLFGGIYTELGATWTDNIDGTGAAIVGGQAVDTNIPGAYIVTYDYTDTSGNPAIQVSRTVNVIDNEVPVITLNGSSTIDVLFGGIYTELGAAWTDNVDGTGVAIVGGQVVDTNILGSYIVTYDYTDTSGNPAIQVSRTVNVIDNMSPVVTLNGSSTVDVVKGLAYVEVGASSIDAADGDISAGVIITGTVDTTTIGQYILTYSSTDSSGNMASTSRTVNVIADTVAPIITITGLNPMDVYLGVPYVEEGAIWTDNVDGTGAATVGGQMVDHNTLGSYLVTYDYTDAAGNVAIQVTRTVNVIADIMPPVITLNGSSTVDVVKGLAYVEAGASSIDAADGDISAGVIITGTVDTTIIGQYILTYSSTDSSGNIASTSRTVNVIADTVAPVITIIGANPANAALNSVYMDEGATALDNIEGDLTLQIIATSSVNTAATGTYSVVYSVSDSLGNSSTATRTVEVVLDAVSPVISVTGSNMSIYQGSVFTDPGATALDNIDGDISANILVTGDAVNVTATGTYIIRYNVSDSSGNASVEATRTVTVLPILAGQTYISSNMTIGTSSSEIIIDSSAPATSTINVSANVLDAMLNLSALISTGTTAVLPSSLNINSDTAIGGYNIQIPAGTIAVGESGWTGVVHLPQVQSNSSVIATPDSGKTASVNSVIELGFGNSTITFDKGVRILFPGKKNQYVGYERNGVFTKITNVCSADSQAAGDLLPVGGDCKINVGNDLVVWTKHFTRFATYTQSTIPVSSGGGGGGGSGGHIFDKTPPTNISVFINDNEAYTNSGSVNLNLSAKGAKYMFVSNDSNFTGSEIEAYSTEKLWDLNFGEGKRTVYVKFQDEFNNVSEIVSDSIIVAYGNDDNDNGKDDDGDDIVPHVLGVKLYPDGTLLRDEMKHIFVVDNGMLIRIKNLEELRRHAGKPIINTTSQVIAQYKESAASVDWAKMYGEGSLLRDQNKKIYVVQNGYLSHIKSLDELKKYAGKKITNISLGVNYNSEDSSIIKNGSLIRGSDKKIYLIVDGKKKHIKSMDELKKYAGQKIINVSDSVIANNS